MKAKVITIQPTSKKDSDGYHTAIITAYSDSDCKESIYCRIIDSFILIGRIQGDFEGPNGTIKLWSYDSYLEIEDGYNVTIISH